MSADRPRLGLIGYGAFGQLCARELSPWFEVLAHDPAGVEPDDFARPVKLAEAAVCPIAILAVPVEALADTLETIGPYLGDGALVLDVGSVKVLPGRLMAERLPARVRAVGLHPLFGPQSARDGVEGHRIAVCPVRGDPISRRVAAFCRKALKLKVYQVSAEDHDREAATVQGLTHLIARVLLAMEPLPSRMTTASFERILQAVDMVRHDSPAVFRAIERDNPFSAEVRDRFFDLALRAREELDGLQF